jgi:hypothetical protein
MIAGWIRWPTGNKIRRRIFGRFFLQIFFGLQTGSVSFRVSNFATRA